MKAHDFQRRIIPIILPDAGLSEGLTERFQPGIYWKQQAQDLAPLVENNFDIVSPAFLAKYRLIGKFACNSYDMIEYLVDQLQPHNYDRQMEEGFVELCQQILEG